MSNVSGTGTVWNLLNYLGTLFTASRARTPLLNILGGLDGTKETSNFEFATNQDYDLGTASQPAITETASLTAPTATTYVREQDKNVTQIFQESVSLSYAKLSNRDRLSGISTTGKDAVIASELDFQIMANMQKIARDVEFTFLQGVYQIATSAGVANKTRGMNAAAETTIAAGSVDLSKPLIQQLLKEMFDAGSLFEIPVFIVNAFQKQALSEIYAYAPTDRNIGGVNIQMIETDFGEIGVMLNSFQLASTLLCADLAVVSAVSQPVPGKGHMFYEELAKTGAGEEGQLFGQIGLDHGPGWAHGTITGLTTS